MRFVPFFSTDRGKVCGAALVVAVLLGGLSVYRLVCESNRPSLPPSPHPEHQEMYRSLEEQTRLLEVLQQDVDAANENLDAIGILLKAESP